MGASDVRVEKGQLQVGEVQLNSTPTSSLTVCCLGTFLTDSYCTTFTTVLAWIALRLSSSKASPLNFWTPAHHFSSDKDIDPPPHPIDLAYLLRPAPLKHKQAEPNPRLQHQDDNRSHALPISVPVSVAIPLLSPTRSRARPRRRPPHDNGRLCRAGKPAQRRHARAGNCWRLGDCQRYVCASISSSI